MSRTMVEMYGRDQFDIKDIAKAWSIIFKLGIKNPNFIGMFEQINAEYQMANAGVNEIEELINGVKTGVLNFESDILYIFNKIPDYFHRMGIFIAKMLHDGSWYAHSTNDVGVLVYDFNSDERFNLLNKPGVNKNSAEYKKQLGDYITLRQQFIKEGFNDFLAKPVESSVLQRTLKKYIPKNKQKAHNLRENRILESPIEKEDSEQQEAFWIDDLDVEKGLMYCGNKENYLEILASQRAKNSTRVNPLWAITA